MRIKILLVVAAALVSCATVPETKPPPSQPVESRPDPLVPRMVDADRPEWFRSEIAYSAYAMQSNGCEAAPLELVDSDDPLWTACLSESARAGEAAQQRVYSDALNECIAWRGVEPRCCFARVNDELNDALDGGRCEQECAAKRVPGRRYRPSPKCESTVVTRRLDPTRFRSPAVDRLLARCAINEVNSDACATLPTRVERSYCVGACDIERSWFADSLRACRSRAYGGRPAVCEHLFADKPIVSPATMSERKAACERLCVED